MDWNLEYGELSQDKEFVGNCEELKKNLMEVQNVLDQLLPLKQHYDKLSLPAKIELDLFLLFALNSLYWINLRINGVDPTKHRIKHELDRVKAAMLKWQEVKDKNKMIKVDLKAAQRFIRNGLYDPHNGTSKSDSFQPQNKKIKFQDSDEDGE